MAVNNKTKRHTARKAFVGIPDAKDDGAQTNLYDYMEGGTLAALVETAENRKLTREQKRESERQEYERMTGIAPKPIHEFVLVTRPKYTESEEWREALGQYGELASMKGRSVHVNGVMDETLICESAEALLKKHGHIPGSLQGPVPVAGFPTTEEFCEAIEILEKERLY